MSRALTAAVAAEFAKRKLKPALLLEAQFATGYVRLWSGIGNLTWNTFTWAGLGISSSQVMDYIAQLSETADLQALGIAISMSGIPANMLQQVLNECRQCYAVNIYFGAMDEGGQIIPDPYKAWGGTMDVPAIADGGATITVSISVENRLIDLQRARERRYTDEDQQLEHTGDLGYQFVGGLQSLSLNWGNGGPVAPSANVPVPVG